MRYRVAMIEPLITGLFLVAAVIHLLPVVGVVGAARLTALYDLPIQDPNLEVLMRHRAVLFGLVGACLAWAAFAPAVRPAGLVVGLVSVVSFLVLARSVGGYNAALRRVVVADLIALVALLGALLLVVL